MKNNPGRSMTIYDIPEIVEKALPQATTPVNICLGFRVAGVYPFNRDIFQDDEYAPSYSTDRPDPSASSITECQNNEPEPATVNLNPTSTKISASSMEPAIVSTVVVESGMYVGLNKLLYYQLSSFNHGHATI